MRRLDAFGALAPEHRVALGQAHEMFAACESHDFGLIPTLDSILLVGSRAYGTDTPESDYDYLYLVQPPARHLVGLGKFEGYKKKDDATGVDIDVSAIRRYVQLALDGNPNVIETLFLPDACYLREGPAFARLRRHKQRFLSRRVYGKLTSYASGQMKKMTAGATGRYMGHARKELVQRIGYDPKDASRLIHLLYMGHRLARTGEVVPHLPAGTLERDVVCSIKRGEWHLESVKTLAGDLTADAEALFHENGHGLPEQPDTDFIEMVLIDIITDALS